MTKRKVLPIKRPKQSVNQDTYEILLGYYKYSSPAELKFDWGLPVVISLVSFFLVALLSKDNALIINILVDINSASLNVMAILAGFNTTSMAVIASTNQETLFKLFNTNLNQDENSAESKNKNILRQVLIFFSYAIVVQLLILIIGSIIVILNKNAQPIFISLGFLYSLWARIIISILGMTWFTIILHSLLVSVRNVSILYRYILFLARHSKKE